MSKKWPKCNGIVVRGRHFSQSDLVLIRKLIRTNPSWGRTKLSQVLCDKLDWHSPSGLPKERGCRVALLRLESLGFLVLPTKKTETGGRPPNIFRGLQLDDQPISSMPAEIQIRIVENERESLQWNSIIAQFHYIGLATPVGRLLRYFVYGDDKLLGLVSFSEPAWSVTARDSILTEIGFNQSKVRDYTISNNRFLIMPFVNVKNLASRVLGQAIQRVIRDWYNKFGVVPEVAETFVDPVRFVGTCYLAANWIPVGTTKGFAKRGQSHTSQNAPKRIFLKGLSPKIQKDIVLAVAIRKCRAA